MLWLKMQHNSVNTAIDLSGLGLDQIEETEDTWRLGAMVSLRALELHPGLNDLTQGALRESVRHIVGVQFRNLATVGGSVFGRFGFSDVLTLLLALDARVVQRNVSTDFPVLTCALSRCEGTYTCVIGARPQKAAVFADEKGILSGGVTPDSARAFAEDVAARARFGSNIRAGEEYRREICQVLVRRGLLAMEEN